MKKTGLLKKFDVVVGNPPYQVDDAGESTGKTPIYQHFMQTAQILGDRVSLIYPAKFLQGGKGLRSFREKESTSKHYSYFYNYSNSKNFFPEVSISGGICFFLWDKNKTEGDVNYYYNDVFARREHLAGRFGVPQINVDSILEKIYPTEESKTKNLYSDDVFFSRDYYGDGVTNYKKTLANEKSGTNTYVYAVDQGVGIKKIEVDYDSGRDLNDWKVGVTRTAAALKNSNVRRLSRVVLAEPDTMLSGSLIKVGSFQTKAEAVNLLRYLKTNFVSFLINLATPTHDFTRENARLIPTIDFETGEIMSKPGYFLNFDEPETLDEQLFNIYKFSENEIKIIKKGLRPWNDKINIKADE